MSRFYRCILASYPPYCRWQNQTPTRHWRGEGPPTTLLAMCPLNIPLSQSQGYPEGQEKGQTLPQPNRAIGPSSTSQDSWCGNYAGTSAHLALTSKGEGLRPPQHRQVSRAQEAPPPSLNLNPRGHWPVHVFMNCIITIMTVYYRYGINCAMSFRGSWCALKSPFIFTTSKTWSCSKHFSTLRPTPQVR